MALKACPDCGRALSTSTSLCRHCTGVREVRAQPGDPLDPQQKRALILLTSVLFAIVCVSVQITIRASEVPQTVPSPMARTHFHFLADK